MWHLHTKLLRDDMSVRAHCFVAAAGLEEVDVELDDAVSGALINKRSQFCGKERAALTVIPLLPLGRQGGCSSWLG